MAEETKTEEEQEEQTEEEQEEQEEEEEEETAEAEESETEAEASDNGAPVVDLSDEAEEVAEGFQGLQEDQRKEVFLKVVSESQTKWIADVVDSMEDRFGISPATAAVAAAPAAGGGDEEEEEEKAVVDVVLEDFGDEKIQVIKAVRAQTDLGLKEAKALVDEAPNPVKEGVPKEEAEEIQEELEDAGATVSLK